MEGYFRFLHRPLEDQGVRYYASRAAVVKTHFGASQISFWWIDWQQGSDSGMVGLDPLAWLNHLHWHDLRRDGRRAYILSRWAGTIQRPSPLRC